MCRRNDGVAIRRFWSAVAMLYALRISREKLTACEAVLEILGRTRHPILRWHRVFDVGTIVGTLGLWLMLMEACKAALG